MLIGIFFLWIVAGSYYPATNINDSAFIESPPRSLPDACPRHAAYFSTYCEMALYFRERNVFVQMLRVFVPLWRKKSVVPQPARANLGHYRKSGSFSFNRIFCYCYSSRLWSIMLIVTNPLFICPTVTRFFVLKMFCVCCWQHCS